MYRTKSESESPEAMSMLQRLPRKRMPLKEEGGWSRERGGRVEGGKRREGGGRAFFLALEPSQSA